jgi:hypothetical protein
MEIKGTVEIAGEGNGSIVITVDDGDDVISIGEDVLNLTEARELRSLLTLAILAAEHNVTTFDA